MARDSLWKFPLDLDSNSEEYPHRITFMALESRVNSPTPAPGGMVALYLPPEALKAAYTQSYAGTDMGALGIALAGVSRTEAQNLATAAMNASGEGAVEALSNMFGGSSIGQSLMAATAKEALGKVGGQAGTAVQALMKKTGVIMNPHKAMIYQGPGGFRTFNYTFTMSPQNKDEAHAVSHIVYYFKYHMHPGVAGVSDTGTITAQKEAGAINTSAALTYPEEFEIKMLVNNKKEQRSSTDFKTGSYMKPLFRIGKCVLESFSVDYATSAGAAFFADGGEPVTTTISLGFKETVLMTKATVARGF